MNYAWLVVLFLAAKAGTQPDVSALPAASQQAFSAITHEEFCTCGSSLTLAGCIELRPHCAVASDVASFIVRGLSSGNSQEQMLGLLSQRVMGPFCAAANTFKLPNAPSKGPKSATLNVVEFADFRCPHCKHAAPMVKAALKPYGDKLRFTFVPFPLQNHPQSIAAAEAALAALPQNKFWEMQTALFAYSSDLDDAAIHKVATEVGLDMKRFTQAMTEHTFRDQVLAMKQEGVDAGVDGTPAFFINGRPYEFDPDLYTLPHRLQMELDRNVGSCQ